jgi:choice-of-anchor B domain-containing protein
MSTEPALSPPSARRGAACRALARPLLGLIAGAFAAAPILANDPPIRMIEPAANGHHLTFRGQGNWGYADASGEYALITTASSLLVVDATDPEHPVIASTVPSIGADMKEVKTYQHYAYCVNQFGPLQIVDLSDPYHAYTVGSYLSDRVPGSHNVWISEDGFAYLAMQGAHLGELRILDLADPLLPVERGSHVVPAQGGLTSCHDVYVRNDTCYASWFNGGLLLLDVRNKDFPSVLLTITYPQQSTHNAWPTVDGRYVCTTDERPGGHLMIWDLGGRFNVDLAAEYTAAVPAIIHNVHLKGPRAYLSYYSAGVRIVDLADPRRPVEIGAFDTHRSESGRSFDGCWSVFPYTASGLIYASDRDNGLFVLRHEGTDDGVVRGRVVVHGAEASRVPGVEVFFVEAGVKAVSDGTGFYQARIYPGVHTLRVSGPGFRTETQTVHSTSSVTELNLILDPNPGEVEFAAPPPPLRPLADGRFAAEARVRAHDAPVSAVTLRYRSGGSGSFRSVEMARPRADDELYQGYVPTQLSGTLVQYYLEATDEAGNAVTLPAGAPAELQGLEVGAVEWKTVLAADFEDGAEGFTVGSPLDTGDRGVWSRAALPADIPDSLFIGGQPTEPTERLGDSKHGHCMLTESGQPGEFPGDHAVSGRTTLVSPPIALGDVAAAQLEFALWYVNYLAGSTWQDPLLVEATTNGGTEWRVLAQFRTPEPGWQPIAIDLGERIDLAAASELQLRFVVADGISPSLLEAAVDDLRVRTTRGLGSGASVPNGSSSQVVLLRQNIPNPFNPVTTITYQLKETRQVELSIYDARGHLVRRLVDGTQEIGDHAAPWDGMDVRGFAAPSGAYFYRFEAGDFVETRKMMLVK